jgi:NADH pyrophosphatase NudC (nudix superfamily)
LNINKHTLKFCPKCGKETFEPNSAKSFQCKSCGFEFFLNPTIGLAALIHDPDGKLLVVTRKHDPAKGTLDLPGGFIDPGESAIAGIIREVKEEVNLDVSTLTYYTSLPNEYFYGGILYSLVDLAFIGEVESFAGIEPADDVEGYQFIAVEDLDPSKFGMKSISEVISQYKKEFSKED